MGRQPPLNFLAYDVEYNGEYSPATHETRGVPPGEHSVIKTSQGMMVVLEVVQPAGPYGSKGLIRARPVSSPSP